MKHTTQSFMASQIQIQDRYNNHKKSFRHERYCYDSELSKYLWELYEEGKEHKIEWSIIRKINSSTHFNFCKLCLTETYFILNALGHCRLLNKKSKFVNKCRHENKLLFRILGTVKIDVCDMIFCVNLYICFLFSF